MARLARTFDQALATVLVASLVAASLAIVVVAAVQAWDSVATERASTGGR
jgi:cell division protein ZapA (FtsZ GTPase activity inhibitor)